MHIVNSVLTLPFEAIAKVRHEIQSLCGKNRTSAKIQSRWGEFANHSDSPQMQDLAQEMRMFMLSGDTSQTLREKFEKRAQELIGPRDAEIVFQSIERGAVALNEETAAMSTEEACKFVEHEVLRSLTPEETQALMDGKIGDVALAEGNFSRDRKTKGVDLGTLDKLSTAKAVFDTCVERIKTEARGAKARQAQAASPTA